MPDLKITQLIEELAPVSDDLIVIVRDPSGSPVNRKVSLGNLFSAFIATIFGGLTQDRIPIVGVSGLVDTAALRWDADSRLVLASNGQILDPPLVGTEIPQLQIGGDFNGVAAGHANIYLDAFGNVPSINFRRANGTQAAKTAIGVADMLNLRAIGYDGTDYGIGGFFRFRGTNTWATDNHGTDFLVFLTAQGSAAAPVERLRMTATTLKLPFNGQTLETPESSFTPSIHAGGDFDGVAGGIGVLYLDGYGAQPNVTMRRVNGTQASKSALANSDIIFNFRSVGYDGSASALGGLLRMVANGAWTGSNHGQDFLIALTANGSAAAPSEVMRVRNNLSGTVGVNVAAPGAALEVRGTPTDIGYLVKVRPFSTGNSFIQAIANGAANAAGFSFTNLSLSGEWRMFMLGNDGNAMRFSFDSTGLLWFQQSLNLTLGAARKEPTTGTYCLGISNGTAPTAAASDTNHLFSKDVVAGQSNLCAMNEAGRITQLTEEPALVLTLTGTQNNLDISTPTGAPAKVVRLNNASLLTVTGIIPAGYDGQEVTLYGVNQTVNFTNADGGSSAANQFTNAVTSGPTPLANARGSVTYRYALGAQKWVLIQHNMGGSLTAAFNAANFTGNGSMTWTVAAGDVSVDQYFIVGRQMFWTFRYVTTTVGGTPNTTLLRTLPDGYTLSVAFDGIAYGEDNSTKTTVWFFNDSTTGISFAKLAGGNWAAATNTTRISGQVSFTLT